MERFEDDRGCLDQGRAGPATWACWSSSLRLLSIPTPDVFGSDEDEHAGGAHVIAFGQQVHEVFAGDVSFNLEKPLGDERIDYSNASY
jgi:hypothetical protein